MKIEPADWIRRTWGDMRTLAKEDPLIASTIVFLVAVGAVLLTAAIVVVLQ